MSPQVILDLKNQLEVMNIIRKISCTHKIASIVVMHDINLALRYSDKFIILKEGQVYTAGGRDIITPKMIEEVYGVDVHVKNFEGVPIVIPKSQGN